MSSTAASSATIPRSAAAPLIFDREPAQRISRRRGEFLDRLLAELRPAAALTTALDAGCGAGYFAGHLAGTGLRVTACDVSEANVAEAARRHSDVRCVAGDLEDPAVASLGVFDLVVCFGLLYHLENPFRAIRNLRRMTGQVLIVESLIAPDRRPLAVLRDECAGPDQGRGRVAFVPSEAGLVKLLSRSGFPHVYRTRALPDHEEFRAGRFRARRRTVLVASAAPLACPLLIPAAEPSCSDLWSRAGLARARALRHWLRKARGRATYALLRWLPLPWVPVRLSSGVWWLAARDVLGSHLLSRDGFEEGEQRFLTAYLQPGMRVLDVGAHRGLYTLLASRRVGSGGEVVAFEPSPRELRWLRRHAALNRCENVIIEPAAVSDREGEAELHVCRGRDTGCNSLRRPAVPGAATTVRVPLTTLDGYLERSGTRRVDVVKLDVEGAELGVLQGARRLLAQARPLVLCELADVRTRAWDYPSHAVYDLMRGHRYDWFAFTAGGGLRPCARRTAFHENLLAVPEERLGNVAAWVEEA